MIHNKTTGLSVTQYRFLCYSIITSAILIFAALPFYPQLLPTRTFADEPIDVTPTLSISPASPLTLTVTPGSFNSADETISVSTTNYTGYTLNLQTSGSTTDLVHTGDSSLTIPTITLPSGNESITSAGFSNAGYGYSTNGTNYKPAPATSSQGDNLAVTSHENPGTGSHTLTFGAKSETTTPSGTYQNTFTLTATANDAAYSITYNANAGSDTVTNMPSANESTISANIVTISNKIPQRTGYDFLGWAESSSATEATIQPSGTFTINPTGANAKTYYAVWQVARYMQDVATWGSDVATGEVVIAKDIRDGTIYNVARLPDGKLWMTQNLRLDFENLSENISTSNTNNPSTTFITSANARPRAQNGAWCTDGSSSACIEQFLYDNHWLNDTMADNSGTKKDEYGVYYNFFTATAGNATQEAGRRFHPAAGDICPYGWHMPLGSETSVNNAFYTLNQAVNSGSTTDPTGLYAYPVNMVRSGYKEGSNYVDIGTDANITGFHHWERNTNWNQKNELGGDSFGARTYSSDSTNNTVYATGHEESVTMGLTIRCTAGTLLMVNYDFNGGTATNNEHISVKYSEAETSHTFTVRSDYPVKTGYTFLGWSTNADAIAPSIYGGDAVTVTSDTNVLNLYAVWEASDNRIMQDVSSWNKQVSVGESATAIDSRDGKSYTVARMKDGRLWMTKNIQLDFSNLQVPISSSNTNNPSSAFISWANASPPATYSGFCSYDAPGCTQSFVYNNAMVNIQKRDRVGSNYDDYGVYYNFHTVSAGNSQASYPSETTVPGDICPKGWRLPSSGVDSEFYTLNQYENNGSAVSGYNNLGYGTLFNLPYAGHYYLSDYHNSWTLARLSSSTVRTVSDVNYGVYFGFQDSTDASWVRWNWGISTDTLLPARCIADERSFALYYDANGGTNAPSSATFNNTFDTSYTFTISSVIPTSSNDYFDGWYFDDNPNVIYHPGDTVTLSTYNTIKTTKDGTITYYKYLRASWSNTPTNYSTYYMQDVANWGESIKTGQTVSAIDKRDNKRYTVARLNDGHLWMTKNLQLDFSNLTTSITTQNTNNPTAAFMTLANSSPAANTGTWCSDKTDASCVNQIVYDNSKLSLSGIDNIGGDMSTYGIYYNWYAASAGHGTIDVQSGYINGDICPYGWRLPSGGANGEWHNLNTIINGGSATDATGLVTEPFKMVFPGYMTGSYWYNAGNNSYHALGFWSNRAFTNANGTWTYFFSSFVNENDSTQNYVRWTYGGNRTNGYSIRCIASNENSFGISYITSEIDNALLLSDNPVSGSYETSYTFTITSTIPQKEGNAFNGWLLKGGDGTLYQPGQQITVSTSDGIFNGIHIKQLYPSWSETSYIMQDVASWGPNIPVGATVYATDNRDNKIYSVAKLKDGRLWMTQNLKLDFANLSTDITTANTHNPTSAFMELANARPTQTASDWCTDNTSSSCLDQFLYNSEWLSDASIDAKGIAKSEYGVYYNYFTASAGNGGSDVTSATSQGDICPYGWQLPTGSFNGEAYFLNYYQNDGSETDPTRLYQAPVNMINSGYIYGNTKYWWGNYGFNHWTSEIWTNGSNVTYGTSFRGYSDPSNSDYAYVRYSYGMTRVSGLTIRCVAQKDSQNSFAVRYMTSSSDRTPTMENPPVVNTNQSSYSFAIPSAHPELDGYSFNGWIDDKTNTLYQPDQTVTVTTSDYILSNIYYKLLYPSWTATRYMQDVSSWGPRVQLGSTVYAVDKRDGKRYSVSRLEDGNLWMTENLGTDFAKLTENISTANTNNPTSEFMSLANNKPAQTGYSSWCREQNATCNDKILYYYRGNYVDQAVTYKIGTYMNYYAATAGNWKFGNNGTVDVGGDICPYGWKIPVGDSREWTPFKTYNNLVNDGSVTDITGLQSSQMKLQLTGNLYGGGGLYNTGIRMFLWTRTGKYNGGMGVNMRTDGSGNKASMGESYYDGFEGFNIRCIAKEYATTTISYATSNLSGVIVDGQTVMNGQSISLETGELHTISLGALTSATFTGWDISYTGGQGGGSVYTVSDTSSTTFTIAVNKAVNLNIRANYNVIVDNTPLSNVFAQAGKTRYNGYYKMQDMTMELCEQVPVGQGGKLIDVRDNQIYRVIRGNAWNCWMIDNLRLGAEPISVELNSSNTDMQSGSTISANLFNSWRTTTLSPSYDNGQILYTGWDTTDAYGSLYGVLYNYNAATLGSVWGASTTASPTQTVCPKGWALPAGSLYELLISSNGLNYSNIQQSPFYFPLSGDGYNAGRVAAGSYGRYWGGYNSTGNVIKTDHMYFTSTGILTVEGGGRDMSCSVRCYIIVGNG